MTDNEYLALRLFIDHYEDERQRLFPGKCSFTPAMLVQLPQPAPTNQERSAVEAHEFKEEPPVRYFLYVNLAKRQVTTWTGEVLGRITFIGTTWRSNMGDKRRTIRFTGINDKRYSGTYFESTGDYARVKMLKTA